MQKIVYRTENINHNKCENFSLLFAINDGFLVDCQLAINNIVCLQAKAVDYFFWLEGIEDAKKYYENFDVKNAIRNFGTPYGEGMQKAFEQRNLTDFAYYFFQREGTLAQKITQINFVKLLEFRTFLNSTCLSSNFKLLTDVFVCYVNDTKKENKQLNFVLHDKETYEIKDILLKMSSTSAQTLLAFINDTLTRYNYNRMLAEYDIFTIDKNELAEKLNIEPVQSKLLQKIEKPTKKLFGFFR